MQSLKPAAPEQVDDGVEVLQIGPRSTIWSAGSRIIPPYVCAAEGKATGAVAEVIEGVRLGQTPELEEIVTLFSAVVPTSLLSHNWQTNCA